MMGMGINYANLEETKEEVKTEAIDEPFDIEDYDLEEQEYDSEDEYEYEERGPSACITDKQQKTLQAWLADRSNFVKLKTIGTGFHEAGAKFVPILGDGNCMFRAISTFMTASKNNPNGTPDNHDEIRQKACDYIVEHRFEEPFKSIFARRKKPFETEEDFNEYMAKKRATTGGRHTWSDAATANAIAATQGRPVM